jgi:hypothetical protein
MPFPKEALKEILEGLDHTNDAIWTDDGSPLVSEIQRLANDKTVTRGQINDALPGFARKSTDSVAEEEQPGNETGEETSGPTHAIAPGVAETAPDMTNPPGDEELDDPTTENERLRKIAYQRVLDAETNLTQMKTLVSEAQRNVVQAERRHERALQIYSSKYPPISVADNIKQHLARQQEMLRERVTGSKFEPNRALNPIDSTLMDRKRDNGRKGPPKDAAPFLPRKAAISY